MTRARWKAVFLSLGLPGLGELYVGAQRSAALTLILWHVMLVFSVALVFLALPGPLIALPFLVGIITWIVIAVRAARAAARAPQPYPPQAYDRWYWYGLAILFSLLVWQPTLLRYIKSHWVQAFQFPSTAMEPTILPGDFLFASKRPSRALYRNDLVLYESPTVTGTVVLKRIVGIAGDTLAMKDGVLVLNGVPVAEPFTRRLYASYRADTALEGRRWQLRHLVIADPRTYHPDVRNWGPIVVPPDSVFILGDNRDESYDSRFWGALGVDRIRGRPLAIYFSKSRDPNAGLSIRWSRIGHRF